MDDTPSENRIRRRRIVARRGMAFSSSGLSDASEGGGVADINDEVEDLAHAPPARIAPPAASTPPASEMVGGDEGGYNPRDRLAQVGRRSSEYAREYRLGLLHRMLVRKVPLDEIANTLGVSVSTVMRDRTELHRRLREESRKLDIDLIVGNSMATYEEILSLAMRAASNGNSPIAMRLAAMRTGLAAENDKHRMMQASGVYDVLRYRKAAGDGQLSDMQRLLQMTEEMLNEADQKGLDLDDPDADTANLDQEEL